MPSSGMAMPLRRFGGGVATRCEASENSAGGDYK